MSLLYLLILSELLLVSSCCATFCEVPMVPGDFIELRAALALFDVARLYSLSCPSCTSSLVCCPVAFRYAATSWSKESAPTCPLSESVSLLSPSTRSSSISSDSEVKNSSYFYLSSSSRSLFASCWLFISRLLSKSASKSIFSAAYFYSCSIASILEAIYGDVCSPR